MKTKKLYIIPFLCLFLFTQQSFPATGRPEQIKFLSVQSEKSLLNGSRVKPHVEHYINFMVRDGKRQILSLLTRTIEIIEQANKPAFRITQRYDSVSGINTDISVVNRQTLKPLTYRSELSTQTESFDFTENGVKGTVTSKQGTAKTFDETFEKSVFNAVILNEILQSLPFAAGKSFSLQLYNPGKLQFKPTFRVLRSEKIQTLNNQLIDAWVVEMQGGAVPTTYWITKRTQEQIMTKSMLKDGAEFWRVRLFSNTAG